MLRTLSWREGRYKKSRTLTTKSLTEWVSGKDPLLRTGRLEGPRALFLPRESPPRVIKMMLENRFSLIRLLSQSWNFRNAGRTSSMQHLSSVCGKSQPTSTRRSSRPSSSRTLKRKSTLTPLGRESSWEETRRWDGPSSTSTWIWLKRWMKLKSLREMGNLWLISIISGSWEAAPISWLLQAIESTYGTLKESFRTMLSSMTSMELWSSLALSLSAQNITMKTWVKVIS